jgi:hypothetical protein
MQTVTPTVAPTVTNTQTQSPAQTSTDGSPVPTAVSSAPSPAAQTDAKATETKTETQTTVQTPTTRMKSVVGLVLSLEILVKPEIKQPNIFVEPQMVQGIPNDVLFSNQLFMDLYGGSIGDQSGKLKQMAKDAVELEQ